MKLAKCSTDLPIEAIDGVATLLAVMIAAVRDKDFFLGSDGIDEYNETLQSMRRDLKSYNELYDTWQSEYNAEAFKDQLEKMHDYLIEAKTILEHAKHELH